jgi:superfamily I DNA and/or RNA helicase
LKEEQKYLLEEFIFDLTEIPSSDVLVNLDISKKDVFKIFDELREKLEFPLENTLSQIIKVAVQNKRNSDTDSLCIALNGLTWEYKGKNVTSPLILIPISFKINKINQKIGFHLDIENYIFNPFIVNQLKRSYNLIWESSEEKDFDENLEIFNQFLNQNELVFNIENFKFIGNFHHHRYQIVKDLEALKNQEQNHLVKEILGEDFDNQTNIKALTDYNLVSIDKDQLQVFEKIKTGNLVIQGPPGTGKSQVLTNLLAKLLYAGKMNLVVSEKKAALEVLVKKLSLFNLDDFTFISQGQVKSHDFIQKLKTTWDKLEIKNEKLPKNLLLSEQLLAQLQLTIDKMLSKNLIGGISLEEFKNLLKNHNLQKVEYSSAVPEIKVWLEQKSAIEQLYSIWGGFEKLHFLSQNALREHVQLDQEIRQLKLQFEKFAQKFEIETVGELIQIIRQIPRFQIIENESYKKYASVFSSKKDQNKFEKLKTKWITKEAEYLLISSEEKNWLQKPNISQIESWKIQLTGTWWTKRKAEKQIKTCLKDKNIVPQIAIENWLKYLVLIEDIQKLKEQFLIFGIERPALEIESISYIVKQLENEKSNELNQALLIGESKRKQAILASNELQTFHQKIKNVLNNDLQKITLKNLIDLEEKIEEIILQRNVLINFNSNIYNLILTSESPQIIAEKILKSHWVNFESNWPELAKFNGDTLLEKIEKIIQSEQEEMFLFGKEIYFQQAQKFEQLNSILRTTSAKLKPEEKVLKAKLKIGKSILVKEFAKSKQHKTIRELLNSEARVWIEVLTPIWLSTPAQVAVTFPMEKSLFDWVIFDEASQIPLSNALGALQRSKRGIIAGDEQQMSQSNYFTSANTGVDLLHQANYYYPKTTLKHHYRSNHPALISFSNRYFYQNELIAYPSSTENKQPLNLHFIENGRFIDRQNMEEAKAVAALIEKSIDGKDALGIVAFSEQQLDCIWKELSATTQQKINQNIEQGKGFFRALEQVQGDECDTLIISFAYAKNEIGEFHKRFGPLNQKSGSKRLNVLLTRAKKSIHFFSSITSKDLKLSTNESINLLRYYLIQLESENENKTLEFPYDLEVKIEKNNQLLISQVTNKINDARELVTTHDVLTKRGWKIKYEF